MLVIANLLKSKIISVIAKHEAILFSIYRIASFRASLAKTTTFKTKTMNISTTLNTSKLLLSIIAIVAFGFGANAQNVTIPDANFKAYLVGNTAINTNGDTEIQVSEASAYTGQIIVFSMSISDLTGIEAFTGITALRCYNNSLTSLDVSQNTALTYLTCNVNSITSLDLSANTLLTHLECNNNLLTSLDLSNNPSLNFMFCFNMTSLTALNMASGGNTNFTTFNSTNCPNLTCIQVDNATYSTTNWTSIDAASSFSTNCNYPCLVTIPDANFKAYLVGNTAINTNADTEIQCSEASAFMGTINCASLSISDLTGIEAFPVLTKLYCNNNQLTSLNVATNIALTDLACNNNQLTSLNIVINTALTYLKCSYNSLTGLNVSSNTLLTTLYCQSNPLTSLNVATNTALTKLTCSSNQLTNLDVSTNTALTHLNCSGNALTSLSVSNNTALVNLDCYSNQLTILSVNANPVLENLVCRGNQLTSLDVSSCTNLSVLECYFNLITTLDVSMNTNLSIIDCEGNQLTELNVANSNNANLSYFGAMDNPNLTCIQVDDVTYSNTNWTVAGGNIDATANFSINCTVGVEEVVTQNISIYPNPVTSQLTLNTIEKIERISILDVTGKTIKTLVPINNTIDVSDLVRGIYFLQIQSEKGISNSKFIKE